MTGGEFELRVVATKEAKVLSRWLRSFLRVALHVATEGLANGYAPVALQVVDRQTGECVAEAAFGRDLDGAEAARIGLADDLAALTLDEFCATYHFERCVNG